MIKNFLVKIIGKIIGKNDQKITFIQIIHYWLAFTMLIFALACLIMVILTIKLYAGKQEVLRSI